LNDQLGGGFRSLVTGDRDAVGRVSLHPNERDFDLPTARSILRHDIFNAGIRPASTSAFLAAALVATRRSAMRQVAGSLRLDMAQ